MYLGSGWHQQVDRECSKASNKNLPHPMLGNIPTLFSLLFFFTKSTFLSTSGKDLQGKKTMLRSEMLINIRCKHQLLCLDRSGSQVRLFTSPQGPLETPTLQSSLGRPAKYLKILIKIGDHGEFPMRTLCNIGGWKTWTPV